MRPIMVAKRRRELARPIASQRSLAESQHCHFVFVADLLRVHPPVGGLFNFKFSSRPHPRKFGVRRFLAVRGVAGAVSGVACFGLPPLEKIIGGALISFRLTWEDAAVMDLMPPTPTGAPQATLIASSRARNPPICQCRHRPSTSW